MTIFTLCCFAAGLDPDPDAAAEALRAAGYQVFRLPPKLKATLEVEGDDFIEVRGEGDNDDEDARDALEADVNRILSPFNGEIDPSGCVTIAELWTPLPSAESNVVDLIAYAAEKEWREIEPFLSDEL